MPNKVAQYGTVYKTLIRAIVETCDVHLLIRNFLWTDKPILKGNFLQGLVLYFVYVFNRFKRCYI